jgi:light-regulated signal transduction histidine kinase (bacteriophytochrome)
MLILIGVIISSVVVGVAFILARMMTQPLTQLTAIAERISHGEFPPRATPTTTDEIGMLTQAFNRMTEYLLEANRTLEQRAQDLSRSNADLEQFAYVASHDLQEPLRKVASYQGHLEARAEKYITYIVDGATRMQRLIQDLLTYSRAGRADLPLELTAMEAVLQETLATLAPAVQESGAEVSHDALPLVMAHPLQLGQVLQNLIGNGLKFRGDAPPHVHIGAQPRGDTWVFAVRDNGIGLEPQYAERIFTIFQRLHTPGVYPGTGIGLAICKKIVERHGGRIWVESQPGQGATFYFTLPKAPPPAAPQSHGDITRGGQSHGQPINRSAAGGGRPR